MFTGTVFFDIYFAGFWAMATDGIEFFTTEEYLAETYLVKEIPMTEKEMDWFTRL